MQASWPEHMQVAQIRVARPTDQLNELERFYCEGLGLKKIDSFEGHAGYDGIMIGLPDAGVHLEFTQHEKGSPCPAPTADNLLVLYIPNPDTINGIMHRLDALGYHAVEPENPYWETKGITIADPDGWRVVLMNTAGI